MLHAYIIGLYPAFSRIINVLDKKAWEDPSGREDGRASPRAFPFDSRVVVMLHPVVHAGAALGLRPRERRIAIRRHHALLGEEFIRQRSQTANDSQPVDRRSALRS